MSTIRFIADIHAYDLYSLDWRSMSLDDYVENLACNWNRVTGEDDITIVAGDIGHLCNKTLQFYKSLAGKKILVMGNHDNEWGRELYTCGIFSGIHRSIDMEGIDVIHIPDESTLKTHYYIHGHHHYYNTYTMRQQLQAYAKDTFRLNCASDLIGHTPRTLQELVLQKELLLDSMKDYLTI